MIIEALLEHSIIEALRSELGDDVQLVGSRLQTKVEDADKKTIIAVASGFRTHDAFSLSLVNVPVVISIATRVEGDAQSQEHNSTVEKIVDILVGWHKEGEVMEEALSNEKFLAGELRMDGGTTQTYDREHMCWTDTININIRGAEKFLPTPNPTRFKVDGEWNEVRVVGELEENVIPREATEVQIGDEVTRLGTRSLSYHQNLETITISKSVLSIGDYAFSGDGKISNVSVPSAVSSVGFNAFWGCSNLALTFAEKSISDVQNMANYSWAIPSGRVIHCVDGDIVI